MAKRKKVTQLEDLVVEEVSIVDRAANKRRFLMVKNEDGMKNGTQIQVDADGNLVTGDADADTRQIVYPSTPEEVAKSITEATEAIAKRLAIPSDLSRPLFVGISDAMGRLSTIARTLDAADYARDGEEPSKLLPLLGEELAAVAKVATGLAKMCAGGKVAKGDDVPEPTEDEETIEPVDEEVLKAVWPTSKVNGFPDSSFLYIKPGGTKDSEGKTVPRSLRMFPVKDETGKVDLPHVRNAIARAPQADLPPDVKAAVQAKARKLLAAAGGGASKTQKSETETVLEAFVKSIEDGALTTEEKPGEAILRAAVEAIEDKIEKRGAKMSKDRLAALKAAVATLSRLLSEVDASSVGKTAPPAEDPVVAKALADAAATAERLTTVVKRQAATIKTLRNAVPESRAIPVEKGAEPREGRVRWPMDLNYETSKTGESVDSADSFL